MNSYGEYDVEAHFKKLKEMMKGCVVDNLILVSSKTDKGMEESDNAFLGYMLSNGVYYIGLRLDLDESRIGMIGKFENSEAKNLTLKLMDIGLYEHTNAIVNTVVSDTMSTLHMSPGDFFKKGRISYIVNSEAVKQLDMLVEAAE